MNHKCEATSDLVSEELDVEEIEDSLEFSPESDNENIPQLSLSAMTGIAHPQTLELKGHIKKRNVMVLIETRSTHNFLDSTMAKRLNIFTFPMPDMEVMVADGKKIEKVGKYHKVKLQIQDYNLESTFYIVPLRGVDVILGIQWLQTLGTYSANHPKQFIKFK